MISVVALYDHPLSHMQKTEGIATQSKRLAEIRRDFAFLRSHGYIAVSRQPEESRLNQEAKKLRVAWLGGGSHTRQ